MKKAKKMMKKASMPMKGMKGGMEMMPDKLKAGAKGGGKGYPAEPMKTRGKRGMNDWD